MLLRSVTLINVLTTLYSRSPEESDSELTLRVWRGERANVMDYPYFANLGVCGAAIISDSWLVTAAHCINGMKDNVVWVGGNSILTSQYYTIDGVVSYPRYSFISGLNIPVNDIALLHLSQPLTFGDTVQPLELPETEYELNTVHKFAGIGITETGRMAKHLMSINVRTLNEKECLSYLHPSQRPFFKFYMNWIKRVTICTKRVENEPGLCYGDSGSPLVLDRTLIGVASYMSDNKCSSAKVAMFTNVAPFVIWIKTVTGVGYSGNYDYY